MRQNHEGVAVGGPYDGEDLQYWKQDLPISEIGAAFPFNESPAPNIKHKWGNGAYRYEAGAWHWIDGRS